MKIAVDISLYPLADDFLSPIEEIVERLNARDDVSVQTNRMSTQIVGEYETVMTLLQDELQRCFNRVPKAVFAIKILNNPIEQDR